MLTKVRHNEVGEREPRRWYHEHDIGAVEEFIDENTTVDQLEGPMHTEPLSPKANSAMFWAIVDRPAKVDILGRAVERWRAALEARNAAEPGREIDELAMAEGELHAATWAMGRGVKVLPRGFVRSSREVPTEAGKLQLANGDCADAGRLLNLAIFEGDRSRSVGFANLEAPAVAKLIEHLQVWLLGEE